MGSSRSHRPLLERLCLAFEGSVYSIDYSLAPEAPFPVALNEVLGVYEQILLAGKSAKKIVIAGDSAGGGLALASLVNFREEGLEMPACGILISPWTDLAITGESVISCASLIQSLRGMLFRVWFNVFRRSFANYSSSLSTLRKFPWIVPVTSASRWNRSVADDSLRLQKSLRAQQSLRNCKYGMMWFMCGIFLLQYWKRERGNK